ADLMDGTPIYDIKPYVRYSDSHPEAKSGFTDETQWHEAEVVFPDELKTKFLKLRNDKGDPDKATAALTKTLAQRPIPQYNSDGERIYGMPFMGCDIRFRATADIITLTDIIKL
ncbi:MAG: SAM-dependent methyltransferase, partial [Bacteroidales bacterium]|nr:SAM-dependent methyltransferase [Bacteroidales bacterium]